MQQERVRIDRRTGVRAVLLLLAAIVAVVGVGLWIYHDQSEMLRRQANTQLEAIGDLKASGLVEWRTARLAEVDVFYDNPAFVSLARRVIETGDGAAIRDLQDWLANLQANPSYEGVHLLSVDGKVIDAVSSGVQYPDDHIKELLDEAIPTGELTWIDLHLNGDRLHLLLVAPLIDRDSNQMVGVLLLTIDPGQYLYPFLTMWPLPSASGESLIVRREGEEVVFLSPLRFRDDPPMTFRVPVEEDALPSVKGVHGEEGVVESTDYRGVEVVSTVDRVPGTEWVLVSKLDAAEAYQQVQDRLVAILFIIGGSVVGVCALAALWWRNARLHDLRERLWLRAVIESSSDEVYTFDANTLRFTFANKGVAANLGYSNEELLRKAVFDVMPLASEESLRERLERLRSGGVRRMLFETVHLRKDGTRYPVESSVQYIETEQGSQFLVIGADVAERKEAAAALSQRLRYEEAIAASMRALLEDEPIEERLAGVLSTLLEASGASRTYIFRNEDDPELGLVMSQILEAAAEGVSAEIDNPRMQQLPLETGAPELLEALRAREPFVRVVNEMSEDSLMRGDLEAQDIQSVLILPIYVDEVLWGNIGYDDCMAVREWAENDIRLLQVVANGIAAALERDATAQELAEHRHRLERLVEERTADLAFVNKELDVVNEELMSTNEELEFSNEELESANVELETAMSDLERTNEELAEANRAKSAFLASMSHELRTPLNSVIGFSGILGQGLTGPLNEEQATQVDMINKSGRHLLALINDILDLSKVEAGGVRIEREEVDLVEVAKDVIESIRPLAEEKALEVGFETSDERIMLMTDCGKVQQILLNLMANAVKFTEEGSVRISIDVRSGDAVRVLVADTGRGIPRGSLTSVFEPFVQVEIPGGAKTKGTGLGLALSREYAQLLGGEITVRSQEGAGSTFTLVMPIR